MNPVKTADLDPVAEVLVQSYLGTASANRQFHDEWDQPMTIASKAHHMRSIAQALVNQHDRFRLNPDYVEFGRLGFLDLELKRDYLVRSKSAVTIEADLEQPLFPVRQVESKVILVVYFFHKVGLDLLVANTSQPLRKKRLVPSSPATYMGTWSFSAGGGPGFDQGSEAAWDDLGDLGDEDTELGEG
jgi:hypothetical protein